MRPSMAALRTALILAALTAVHSPIAAQQTAAQRPALTAADYARAERFLPPVLSRLVDRWPAAPVWLDDGRFWYNVTVPEGEEFIVVDPERRTREPAFDHERVAAALSAVTGEDYTAFGLPFSRFEYTDGGRSITVSTRGGRFRCDVAGERCSALPAEPAAQVVSPDGRLGAFIRDHNLWVRDVGSGQERRLTRDGIEDFGYATHNLGWARSETPLLLWSPDSKKIATFQHDGRGVGVMYLVSTTVGHPELEAWKYPLPGDSATFMIQRVVIDVETGAVTRLRMPPDPHRSSACGHLACGGTATDFHWFSDGSAFAFVSTSRDYRTAVLRVADAGTGAVRDVLRETVETYFQSGPYYGLWNWRVLPASKEAIWFSERDDWGHLYLYDLGTGELKNRITRGEWVVTEIVRVDSESRRIWFLAAGREPGRNPYFHHFYSVRFDGSDLELLTPEDAHHRITISPDGRYFVDRYSTPTTPPVMVLRDMDGDLLVKLEETDISRLRAAGWQPPVPFTVRARDGVTDLYGLMYRPTNLDTTRSYPIVNYVYPGPWIGSVESRAFSPARRDKQAIAELGFIVVEVDAMGTPGRSKSFHDAFYGNLGDNRLPDQIAMIRQLAERHPYMDIDRVGIYGRSGGGFAAAAAILRYPDFYKVAVSQSGNHDNRNYSDLWGEMYQGLLVTNPDGTTNYDSQANHLLAENLEGKLLIAHGTMDRTVPPSNTLLLVNELIRHNKDFDLILFPEPGPHHQQ